ncbi:S-layer homology domain-containing protein [Thermophilibacter mediterraneus]|uniref:S-layer homology domain-containing protein n=1 Tax=Thermophilibacter mediterraneus TaxID=1871031 RepID=UPI002353EA72|nr:S-layer homology domain-containing protein [Thermophilibacter mediterraneus]
MTACTNNGGSRARRAVTAALVGVLSVGAAPMVALATGAAPASGDVSLMASDKDVIEQGTVTYEGEDSYIANGDPQGLEAVTLTENTPNAKPIDLEYTYGGQQTESGYYFFYVDLDNTGGTYQMTGTEGVSYKNSSNKDVAVKGNIVEKPSVVGNYAVVSGYYDKDNDRWTFVDDAETFTIKARSLDGATLFEDGNVDDTTFMWNGTRDGRTVSNLKIGVAIDGVVLDGPSAGAKADYSAVDIYEVGGTTPVTEVEPGKTYTAKVTGAGKYAGQTEEVSFTLQPLDLSASNIVTKIVTGATAPSNASTPSDVIKTINGVDVVASAAGNDKIGDGAYVAVKFVSAPTDSTLPGGKGVYEFTVAATETVNGAKNTWVTGEKLVEVIYADQEATISAGQPAGSDGVFRYDLSDEDTKFFDIEKISATYGGTSVDEDDIDVTVTDGEGHEASVDDLKTRGTWYVNVDVYYLDSSNQLVAGKASFKVVNSYDTITAANIYVSFDGDNVDNASTYPVTYTGEDFADKIAVKVAKNDVTLAEGTDYTVTIKGEDGKTVDSVVDAGEYTVVVKGLTFTGSFSFTIEVKPAVVEWLFPNYNVVTNDTLESGKYDGFFAYTGDVIDATYTCVDDKGKVIEVPASAFTITYTLDGEKAELKEAGEYKATIKDATVNDNWQVGNKFGVQKIVVSKDKVFADVKSSDFFAQAIYTASAQGYIGGIGGTNLFAPMNQLTRADMACVLYRMAGGSIKASQEDLTDENVATISQFSDVDPHAYYAKAVAWCVEMGVANGYGDTFGSARSISTEEFVTMLARYAAKMGDDTTVDTDAVLAGVADGDQVSGYARDAVAWAVENGYIAKGGNLIAPQESVARWRTVMIAVDYQPEQLHVIGNPDATKPGTGTNN